MATPAIPEQPVIDQPVVIQTKRCPKCGADLPITAFYRRVSGRTLGSWCKVCQRARSREGYQEWGAEWNEQRKQERREMREAGANQRLMSFSEIGRRLGLSPQTAFNVYRSALYKLRQVVTPELRELLIAAVNAKDGRQTWDEAWGNTFDSEEES